MTVWFVNPYGLLPGEAWRDYYTAVLAAALARSGHRATWWAASFSHHFKRQRANPPADASCRTAAPFTVRLLPTPGYSRHVGPGRLFFEWVYGWRLFKYGRSSAPPDFIVTCDSAIAAGIAALLLAKRHRAKLIVKTMDLWPELFVAVSPAPLRPLVRVAAGPLYALRRVLRRRADGLVALSETYLEAARADLPATANVPVALVYNGIDLPAFRRALETARNSSLEAPVRPHRKADVCAVYAGTLGSHYDIPALIEAARLLKSRQVPLTVLVAGAGPLVPQLRTAVERDKLDNLVYLGSMPPDRLVRVYVQADIGLCLYGPASNVQMPDKAYDYMAAGLPIINSLTGELAAIIRRFDMGLQYQAGDPVSLADAMQQLAFDHQRRRRLAENAAKAALHFDREIQVSKFLTLVTHLAEGRRSYS